MEGHPQPRDLASAVSPASSLAGLAVDFRAALDAPDVRGAKRMVAQAADVGALPERLYVEVVRPALVALQSGDRAIRGRLAAGIGEAILADLISRLPVRERVGLGRAALLTCRDAGIEAVDGSVAMDFLEADGWNVQRVGSADEAAPMHALASEGAVELAVAVTSGPEDALRFAPMCTELSRMPDPPVTILCDFSGRTEQRAASTALGADAIARDPGELVDHAGRRLPGPGVRRWGVGLRRVGDTLVLTPTGCLDAISVGRLSDVALSRRGTFAHLVLDLRDLAEIESGAVTDLSRPPWDDLDPVLWGDGRTRVKLAGFPADIGARPVLYDAAD